MAVVGVRSLINLSLADYKVQVRPTTAVSSTFYAYIRIFGCARVKLHSSGFLSDLNIHLLWKEKGATSDRIDKSVSIVPHFEKPRKERPHSLHHWIQQGPDYDVPPSQNGKMSLTSKAGNPSAAYKSIQNWLSACPRHHVA